jgi:hypothetical protein
MLPSLSRTNPEPVATPSFWRGRPNGDWLSSNPRPDPVVDLSDGRSLAVVAAAHGRLRDRRLLDHALVAGVDHVGRDQDCAEDDGDQTAERPGDHAVAVNAHRPARLARRSVVSGV